MRIAAKGFAGKKRLTLGWNKIKNAEGYDIFFARCNHSHKKVVCRKVKNIKGNNIFTWKKSGLKKGISHATFFSFSLADSLPLQPDQLNSTRLI